MINHDPTGVCRHLRVGVKRFVVYCSDIHLRVDLSNTGHSQIVQIIYPPDPYTYAVTPRPNTMLKTKIFLKLDWYLTPSFDSVGFISGSEAVGVP
jgi:hypothetical protein